MNKLNYYYYNNNIIKFSSISGGFSSDFRYVITFYWLDLIFFKNDLIIRKCAFDKNFSNLQNLIFEKKKNDYKKKE